MTKAVLQYFILLIFSLSLAKGQQHQAFNQQNQQQTINQNEQQGRAQVRILLQIQKFDCANEWIKAETCKKDYQPVCGEDGQTYEDKCQACYSGKIRYYSQNECGKQQKGINNFKECENAGYPVQEIYPRQCVTSDGRVFVEEVIQQCTEEQKMAQACPDIYFPVCGDNGITYENECQACARQCKSPATQTQNIQQTKQKQNQNQENQKVYCTKQQKEAKFCTKEYMPVCGDNSVTYGNKCTACSSGKIDWYIEGECTKNVQTQKKIMCEDLEEFFYY